jgi:hypothetical protein
LVLDDPGDDSDFPGQARPTATPTARSPPPGMSAPVAPAVESLPEIRAAVRALLPGAQVRRRLFWRYTLAWTAPSELDGRVRFGVRYWTV